jgi:hypothetical protein
MPLSNIHIIYFCVKSDLQKKDLSQSFLAMEPFFTCYLLRKIVLWSSKDKARLKDLSSQGFPY